MKRNICYQIFCKACDSDVQSGQPGAVESVYPGESCRSARERGAEHLDAYRRNHKDSIMYKHYCEHHGQGAERPEFGMEVLRYHTSATTRQVREAVVIWQRSKCKFKRLVIEDSHKDGIDTGSNVNVRNGTKEQESRLYLYCYEM